MGAGVKSSVKKSQTSSSQRSTSRSASVSRSSSRSSSCKPLPSSQTSQISQSSQTSRSSTSTTISLEEECAARKEILSLPLEEILRSSGQILRSERWALEGVNKAVAKCKRAVVVSGAGISCSSGIPDFRSSDGLYSLVKDRYPDQFVTGKDLFSSGLFNTPETTSLFYTFIAELAMSCHKAQPTRTHHFINRLHAKGKLLRSYTQNIDGLERRVGLESGGRGCGFKKMTTKNVEMHGDLGRVRCVLCMADFEARFEWMELFKEGSAPWCPACEERSNYRIERAARALPIGTLRPSIVLYDENHPLGEQIGDLQVFDLYRKPDLLLIMGTSLKVHGLKRVVREFAKAVHAKKGLVVFVNLTPPSKEWEDVIDIHIQGETDRWVESVEADWKSYKPADWEIQTTLHGEVIKDARRTTKGKPGPKPKKNQKAEPVQLPTPRPSQSPRMDSSSFTRALDDSEDELSPPPSSPLSSCPPSPRMAPLTPSKRRVNTMPSPISEEGEEVPARKRISKPTAPKTGIPATPGKGNLFAIPSSDLPEEWEDIITVSPIEAPSQIIVPRPGCKSKDESSKENARPRIYGLKVQPRVTTGWTTTAADRALRYENAQRAREMKVM